MALAAHPCKTYVSAEKRYVLFFFAFVLLLVFGFLVARPLIPTSTAIPELDESRQAALVAIAAIGGLAVLLYGLHRLLRKLPKISGICNELQALWPRQSRWSPEEQDLYKDLWQDFRNLCGDP